MNFENTYLGIEFGSTRIKACLIDEEYNPIASGGFSWETVLKMDSGHILLTLYIKD